MKSKITVFDKFLGYQVGGAQFSFLSLLKNLKAEFKFVGCKVKKSFGADRLKIDEFFVERIPIFEISKFPYLEYILNRKKVADFFKKENAICLFTQGIWGSIAINNFNRKTVYFIRDEYNLGRIPNYFSEFKWLLKEIYILIQKPILNVIFSDIKKAIEKSNLVIANSQFMAKRIKEIFNKNAEVVYPIIDVKSLQKIKIPSLAKRKYITLVGSEFIKGREIVERIAKKIKNYNFLIVGRKFDRVSTKRNIFYFPWQKDILEIYKNSKIILIPSICEEAFCRVGIEAMALGIPVIGSNRGGIPEILDNKFIVEELWNINKWCQKIDYILKNYQKLESSLKEKAKKFDAEIQIEKFKEIMRERIDLVL